ncbi:MAG: HHL1-like protein [Pseudanabaena sp. ELA607]
MSKPVGFGGTAAAKPKKVSKRQAAAQQYDDMKAKGLPEFNIYIRIKGREWVPAGSLAVQRSSAINQALFQQEAELLKGALRMYPILKQYQDKLEYGYRLKEFKDEEITLAVRPNPSVPGALAQIFDQAKAWANDFLQKTTPKRK